MTAGVRKPVPRVLLGDGYTTARILNGGWQLARGHHACTPSQSALLEDMFRLVEKGFTSFDCADIYTGVEVQLGRFLQAYRDRHGDAAAKNIQIHTKFVPDLDWLPRLTKTRVTDVIDRSLRRLGVARLDLVQFHWWDLNVPRYVETAGWLAELQAEGKICRLGATNFEAGPLREMMATGARFVSNQVQYSLLDRRPESGLVSFCKRHDIHLFCYGSLAGGFLTDRFLGREAPARLVNRSLEKYRLIIEDFGGWSLFQELLETLYQIAAKHRVSVANIAQAYVLAKPMVAAIIVGFSHGGHVEANLKTFGVGLDAVDHHRLAAVLARSSGPRGPVFGLEREPGGPHASIMKTNLNRLEEKQ